MEHYEAIKRNELLIHPESKEPDPKNKTKNYIVYNFIYMKL